MPIPDPDNTRDYAYFFTMGELLEQVVVNCEAAMDSPDDANMHAHLKGASRSLRAALEVFHDKQKFDA